MFFCEDCKNWNKWPGVVTSSRGRCEVCGRGANCYDIPSVSLPEGRGERPPWSVPERVHGLPCIHEFDPTWGFESGEPVYMGSICRKCGTHIDSETRFDAIPEPPDEGIPGSELNYSPEKHGFRTVCELETGGSYEFDTTLVVQNTRTGEFWAAHDSGCSCPVPFEDTKWPTDWVLVQSVDDVEPLMREHSDLKYAEAMDFKRKLAEELG